jgi:hypothetical protein
MRTKFGIASIAVLAIAILTWIMRPSATQKTSESPNITHIVLIGASIGQGWHLAEWPNRAKVNGFTAESIPAWQFDKTEAVDEVLMRPRRKFRPTRTYLKLLFQPPPPPAGVVILKECSSYFPGDLVAYEKSIRNWAARLRGKRIMVALATVVPVTEVRAQQNPGKQESLLRYNAWVRQYAQQQGIILLDLESALRTDDSGHFLRQKYAASDGTHLNATAYEALDNLLRETLLSGKSLFAIRSGRTVRHEN